MAREGNSCVPPKNANPASPGIDSKRDRDRIFRNTVTCREEKRHLRKMLKKPHVAVVAVTAPDGFAARGSDLVRIRQGSNPIHTGAEGSIQVAWCAIRA